IVKKNVTANWRDMYRCKRVMVGCTAATKMNTTNKRRKMLRRAKTAKIPEARRTILGNAPKLQPRGWSSGLRFFYMNTNGSTLSLAEVVPSVRVDLTTFPLGRDCSIH